MTDKQIQLQQIKNCLAQKRLAHAWLFTGGALEVLIPVAKELALILKCENPPTKTSEGVALDNCGSCSNCVRVQNDSHPDIFWLRPESKMRLISVDSVRDLIREVQMKPLEGGWKIAIIVAADRMHQSAANAFLKTLEEPPPQSILILLSTEPHRLLETIVSRCQRVDFGQIGAIDVNKHRDFIIKLLDNLCELHGEIIPRYRLLDMIVKKLEEVRKEIEAELTNQSTLKKYHDADINSGIEEKLEKELKAAVEAEYRRQRQELISTIHWLLRDIWLQTLNDKLTDLLTFPFLKDKTLKISKRISQENALRNLQIIEETQKLLFTNVQESLIFETMFLRITV